eukprot:465143-Alexandrium_andersonii.AAC.1
MVSPQRWPSSRVTDRHRELGRMLPPRAVANVAEDPEAVTGRSPTTRSEAMPLRSLRVSCAPPRRLATAKRAQSVR